jgi:glutamine synthetase
MVFLVMLCAVIKAVDKYAKLLRASVANAGNEHRLGANEAPPAIVSIFLGGQLTDILDQLANGGAKTSRQGGQLKLGISTLPPLPKDCTDRNRTSPFAFTGNRFEFRMPGSTQSTAGPTFVLNTIVADVLSDIADELEKAENTKISAQQILRNIATEHRRIIFNGDNYTDEWVDEAQKRGLPNICSTVDSLKTIMDEENVRVFEKCSVLSKSELQARADILLEAYSMIINIEAQTMLNIVKRQILPASVKYSGCLVNVVNAMEPTGIDSATQKSMLEKLSELIGSADKALKELETVAKECADIKEVNGKAESCRDKIIPAMNKLRGFADELEMNVDADLWPLPTYAEMLFLK